jgi:hypothetical protein
LREVVHDRWWKNAAVFYFGENPANQHEITSLVAELDLKSDSDKYSAAVAIGLATQACYLSKVAERVQCLKWVVEALGATMKGVIEELFESTKSPLLGFILYYAHAKDAVGSELIGRVRSLIEDTPENEAAHFWCLVGLIEAGQLEVAYNAIRHYRPAEQKFMLGIVLGCFVIEGLRITSETNKGFANKIRGILEGKVRHLATELSKEFDSLMLEVRAGQMKSIPPLKALPEAKPESD